MNTPMNNSKREFLKKTVYVIPVILTLKSAPSLAGTGSPRRHKGDDYDGHGQKSREYGKKTDKIVNNHDGHGQKSHEYGKKTGKYGNKGRAHERHRHNGFFRSFRAAVRKAF